MGFWNKLKQGAQGVGSWVGGQVDTAWSKVPEFTAHIDVKVDAKIRFDSGDIRVGLEAIGQGLDSVGAGLQTGLSDVGAGVGTAGIALGQGLEGAGRELADGLEAVGRGIENFDPTGGFARRLFRERDRAAVRFHALQRLRHYIDSSGQPLKGDGFSLRFRNESDVVKAVEVRAEFLVAGQIKQFWFELDQTPRPNDVLGWEQVITLPSSLLGENSALPSLQKIEAFPREATQATNKYQQARDPFIRVSVDVFRVSGPFEHYVGGGSYVFPRIRKQLNTIGQLLTIEPADLDFGETMQGGQSPTTRIIRLLNMTSENLAILGIEAQFINRPDSKDTISATPSATPDNPITIPTGVTTEVVLKYHADRMSAIGEVTGALAVRHGAKTSPATSLLPFRAKVISAPPPMTLSTSGAIDPSATACPLDTKPTLMKTLELSTLGCIDVSNSEFGAEEAHFCVKIDSEVLLCAGKRMKPPGYGGDTIFLLSRGFGGTTRASHDKGREVLRVDFPSFPHALDEFPPKFAEPNSPISDLARLLSDAEDKVLDILDNLESLTVLSASFQKLIKWFKLTDTVKGVAKLRKSVQEAESFGLDSNVLFLLRLSRILNTDQRNAPDVWCKIKAKWSNEDGDRVMETTTLVSHESIVPLQRPVVVKDWTGLTISVFLQEGALNEAAYLNFQVAQAFLTDVRILTSMGGLKKSGPCPDGWCPIFETSYKVNKYQLPTTW